MINIVSIWKNSTNFDDIHSLTKHYFKNDEFVSSCKTPSHFIIAYKNTEKICFGLQNPNYIKMIQHKFDSKREVYLECNVSFSNRHASGKEVNIKRLMPKEALDYFCLRTGINPVNEKFNCCEFLGVIRQKKFGILNAFKISGYFKIDNLDLFNQALDYGIGSYKSYGFGLILIKEIL